MKFYLNFFFWSTIYWIRIWRDLNWTVNLFIVAPQYFIAMIKTWYILAYQETFRLFWKMSKKKYHWLDSSFEFVNSWLSPALSLAMTYFFNIWNVTQLNSIKETQQYHDSGGRHQHSFHYSNVFNSYSCRDQLSNCKKVLSIKLAFV